MGGAGAVTPLQAAQLVNASYAYPGDPPYAWDHWEPRTPDGLTVAFGYAALSDCDAIVFPGTSNPMEWLIDFDFVLKPRTHADLGDVHFGFLVGMELAWLKIEKLLRPSKPLYLLGHSLGAARADVACGFAIRAGVMPEGRIVFGEPYPGFASFCVPLMPIKVQASYCNGDARGHDIVTNVPLRLPPKWAYTRPTPLISVSASPSLQDEAEMGDAAYHHMPLYVQALRAIVNPLDHEQTK